MNARAPALNRRAFLARLVPGRNGAATARSPEGPERAPASPGESIVAVVAGRFCLAYQGSFCSVCYERCPEAGAIKTERGLPQVNADCCTGCRICHEVCPAPTKAIRLVPRQVPAVPPYAAS